jgi:hypothetical protein
MNDGSLRASCVDPSKNVPLSLKLRFGLVLLVIGVAFASSPLVAAQSTPIPVPDRDDNPSECPGTAALRQPGPIFPSISAPPPGAIFFDVVVPEVVSPSRPFSVLALTTRPQMPLAGVLVVLRDLAFIESDRAVTGPDGQAVLNAPFRNHPESFFVEATREDAANYVPVEDARAIESYDCTTGFYPINFVSVLPALAVQAVQPLDGQKQKLEIDEGLGWSAAISFSELIEKATKKNFDADEDWWARRTHIDEHLAEKNARDTYIFYGHGGDSDGDASTAEGLIGWSKFMWARGGRFKSLDAMLKSVKSDKDPPGIVFLGACSTHSLLQPLVDASVKLALGFTNKIDLATAAGALKAFWEAFLDGKTLQQALDAANELLDKAFQQEVFGVKILNVDNADLVFKGKAWVTGDMTLEQIKKHER